jgi:hypothetical protein
MLQAAIQFFMLFSVVGTWRPMRWCSEPLIPWRAARVQ